VSATTVYIDVDGTLVGHGGDLLAGDGPRLIDALLRCRAAGIAVVPVTGRGRIQVRELCRLLGFRRGIAELGCVHLEGHEVRYELGDFPFVGETPVERMLEKGLVELAQAHGLESHEPWNEGREATYLLRGKIDVADLNSALERADNAWCELVDNGLLRRADAHVYHLAPKGTGKARGIAIDLARHGVPRDRAFSIGDAASDIASAELVNTCWLVANADPDVAWPNRTVGAHGDGVAEVLERLLS
jgi:hydroxymethylpyrimidine pyrophosphatase-like HAD family hydrolase